MNLYFRLLLFIFSLPFIKTEKKGLAVSEYTCRVLPNDIDFNWHMNNGRYLTMMDFGRFHLIARMGLFRKIFKKGWAPAVGSAKIVYLRDLKPFQKYRIKTQLVYWDEKWIYMEQKFLVGEELMAIALVKALFTHKGKKIPTQELISLTGQTFVSPPLPENIKKWQESDKLLKSEK